MFGIKCLTRECSAVAAAAIVCGCSSLRSHPANEPACCTPLSETERVAHVLSRLTFGPRPGDAERVAAVGVERWIDQQLHPDAIPDSAVVAVLATNRAWNTPVGTIGTLSDLPRNVSMMSVAEAGKDSSARAMLMQRATQFVILLNLPDYLYAGKIVRAQTSERQLLELLSDFWENHFSVYSGKMPERNAVIEWDRDVLRPRALGKFRDLLIATAHSPAMLYYLDNHLSTNRGLNENYARELMELHTLGVDGGYTQKDVQEVARALTGWTKTSANGKDVFAFTPALHDTGAKIVLGHVLPAGRGIEDGNDVLDILARHPSTARHIAFKLARRLVADDPPPTLVARAAATFTQTDGDIVETVRTIVTSKEFFSHAAFRAKVKTPFEFVVSARRALNYPADTSLQTARSIARLGQQLFGWATPEGWPETGIAWINSGTLYARIIFATNMANSFGALTPSKYWTNWAALSALPLAAQVDAITSSVLGGATDAATRDAMLAVRVDAPDGANVGELRLRELLTIAFASPAFQRR
jgi:uncharacterized protein (DUF1800 family)